MTDDIVPVQILELHLIYKDIQRNPGQTLEGWLENHYEGDFFNESARKTQREAGQRRLKFLELEGLIKMSKELGHTFLWPLQNG